MKYINIGGVTLIIDLNAMTNLVSIDTPDKNKCEHESTIVTTYDKDNNIIGYVETVNTFNHERQVDTTRYEIVRTMLDILLTYNELIDDKLGVKNGLSALPINLKIAINSLMNYGILKEI